MGNWRMVNLIGTCAEGDVSALRKGLDPGKDYDNFHPLCRTGGLCGLGNWAGETISAIGNLAERDYSVESVAEALRDLVKLAPSLEMKAHCGDERESDTCIATINVKGGEITVDKPEIPKLMAISEGQIKGNLLDTLMRPRDEL